MTIISSPIFGAHSTRPRGRLWSLKLTWVALLYAALLGLMSACGGHAERTGLTSAQGPHRAYPLVGRYTPITMLTKYAGEDEPPMDMGFFGGASKTETSEGDEESGDKSGEQEQAQEPDVVLYWDDQQRAQHMIHVREGKLVDAQGQPIDAELDAPGNEERGGSAIFVMDVLGNLYYCFDQRYGRLHHSTLSAGLPVAAAGELVILKGELVSISNASGHYRPAVHTIDLVLGRLKELGAQLNEVKRFEILPKEGEAEPERLPLPLPSPLSSRKATHGAAHGAARGVAR